MRKIFEVKKLFIPPVLVFICMIMIILFYFAIPEYNFMPFPLNLIGVLIAFSGLIIMGKSWNLFKKFNTTLSFNKSSYLITEGIFAKTRNPMYLGMFLLLLGIALYFCNIFSIISPFAFITLVQILFIPAEEKMMHETFGKKYLDYKKNVRRWI